MQRIYIKNLGPVKEFESDVDDFSFVFIGPQASGKSTIAKAIYFFKSLRDDLLEYIIDAIEKNDLNKINNSLSLYISYIEHKIEDYWSFSYYYHKDFYLEYSYKDKCSINITKEIEFDYDNVQIIANFSEDFKRIFDEIISDVANFLDERSKNISPDIDNLTKKISDSKKRAFLEKIKEKINSLFNDDRELFFIPAGRSLMAILSKQLLSIDMKNLDYLTKEFIEMIKDYNEGFQTINKFIKTSSTDFVNKARNLTSSILKGNYHIKKENYLGTDGEEGISFEDSGITKHIGLKYSSSGQQEAIWILNLILFIMVLNTKNFIVIEEPEAHLYPEAQKSIVELIFLLANSNNNQVIITTHSPYILSSINNLLYANKVGEKKPQEVNERINKKLWISHKKLKAFFVANGEAEDIMDAELQMIKDEKIDSASSLINKEYDFLYNLEDV